MPTIHAAAGGIEIRSVNRKHAANDFSFLSLLFLEKEVKNIRCAKIPKNCTSKAKSFKLLLLDSEASA